MLFKVYSLIKPYWAPWEADALNGIWELATSHAEDPCMIPVSGSMLVSGRVTAV